jgi:hypothetical protein
MTSNGRRESSGLLGAIAGLRPLISPSVRRADFLAFDDDGATFVAWLPTKLAEGGRSNASRNSAHTGAWSLASSSPRM